MAKGPSKARESRVNIAISDKLKGGAEPELPFRMLVMGDYTLKDDDRAIYDRKPLDINKSNFDNGMQSFNLAVDLNVDNEIGGGGVGNVASRRAHELHAEGLAHSEGAFVDALDLFRPEHLDGVVGIDDGAPGKLFQAAGLPLPASAPLNASHGL